MSWWQVLHPPRRRSPPGAPPALRPRRRTLPTDAGGMASHSQGAVLEVAGASGPAWVEAVQTRGIAMMLSDQPEIVTVVASPPPGTSGPTDNNFIDAALQTLATKNASANRVVRAASVRDLDIELGKILTDHFKGAIRLQIIGHSISGMLSLGASWIP